MTGDITAYLSLALGAIGVISAVCGALAWHSGRVRKSYAAERDFAHLQRHYEALAQNQNQLWREVDSRFDRVDRDLDKLLERVKAPDKA